MPAPNESQPIRILLVDDDPVVLKVYEKELNARGFKVEQVSDGLAAMKALRSSKPDLVVLDLMMPKMSGADVLRFIRSQPELVQLPVIVLSNAYMDNLAREAAAAGAQRALLKASCTPGKLAAVIDEVLYGQSAPDEPSLSLAAPVTELSKPQVPPSTSRPSPAQAAPSGSSGPAASTPRSDSGRTGLPPAASLPPDPWSASIRHIRKEFLERKEAICAELRALFQALSNARNDAERTLRLNSFYQKIHFVTANAGLAECPQIARLAAAVEAFIFEVTGKRSHLNTSSLRTLALTIDFLGELLAHAGKTADTPVWSPQALVVDDDALSNRLVLSALRTAQISGTAFQEPSAAVEWLKGHACDLVLLDVEMPGMDGFEVCKQLRALPNHAHTPVVYVTTHGDFEHRSKSVLSGGDDLIAKPILPLELAVKSVMHVLKRQMRSVSQASAA